VTTEDVENLQPSRTSTNDMLAIHFDVNIGIISIGGVLNVEGLENVYVGGRFERWRAALRFVLWLLDKVIIVYSGLKCN
jgi:hypothetical protein